MTRLARLSSSLLLGTAAIAGCAEAPVYQGNAALEPVAFYPETSASLSGDLPKAALKYVRNTDQLTGYDDDWQVRSTFNGSATSHVRLDQIHDGVPVWGADLVVHAQDTKVDFIAGNLVSNLGGFDVHPEIDASLATATAKADYSAKLAASIVAPSYDRESSEIVIFPQQDAETRLAYHVVFFTEAQGGADPGLWSYFVDAKTGDILQKYNSIHTLVPQASGPGGNAKVARQWMNELDVRRDGAVYLMDTTRLQTLDMAQQTSGGTIASAASLDGFGDPAINDAHGFAESTLNMLSEWQGFNSIDNNGFLIKSRVHYAVQYENAFWDGTQMTYGDGRTIFYPLSGDVDVVAHEINHGFTSFHSNLIYSRQSGGLNESFSDIAGTVTEFFVEGDHADFDLGRDIFKGDRALRFMCDPKADGVSIDHFSKYNDGLDVHYTSGISNKAFCLSAQRLSPTGTANQASVKRASLAWYRANAAFWTASTTFQQGCQGVLDASRDLGFSDAERQALRQSWADVGVSCNL
jgi:Zn-dependent metalloprotease